MDVILRNNLSGNWFAAKIDARIALMQAGNYIVERLHILPSLHILELLFRFFEQTPGAANQVQEHSIILHLLDWFMRVNSANKT